MTMHRCRWAGSDARMQAYHDEEWGVPVRDSRALWEKLVLDTFQAGLSWRTILHKRDAFRAAFEDFDPRRIAGYGPAEIERLMADAGIVRARAKIEATIRNARGFLAMAEKGEDFSDFVWSFVDGEPCMGDGTGSAARSSAGDALSAALKKRGFSFVGPVVVHAWLQAVGVINDHETECFRREAVSL
ncbi:DNA-3-methyladenine glycosylase I [Novosphingobium sp. TCA1]|uniref:3-methyladenine DNA glycosylase n=1 Tax=Novosphingobium pentaromativorans TaxID=205844 RepID=A0A2W5QIK3_9SPHN|nr:DNA-3-methyladenine glycosylase I [Novosphingobium sp. TCA1]PZQ57617.1 MAG: 3-methyladenine DNA glycosylase [Novosphingobium pentaromativorans]GFE73847.1 DNA-3-methyladenine glycosylase I [Novosphingobium sp. TCA1]